jgi:hypothetical protein
VRRPLTPLERDVLTALLAVDLDDAPALRDEARSVRVVGGCPTIYFSHGSSIAPRVDARVIDSDDTLFLFTVVGRLGGIGRVNVSDVVRANFPTPARLVVSPARWHPSACSARSIPPRVTPGSPMVTVLPAVEGQGLRRDGEICSSVRG